jgi:dTDP-4-dehydrorhamnose reductase
MSVIILGGTGQLGSEFKLIFPTAIYPEKSEIDLSMPETIDKYFSKVKPDIIVNCAAYTKVDKAEAERDQVMQINAESVGMLGRYADAVIHFSTDYVFDGRNHKPYIESDPLKPINFYGESKAKGEELLFKANPNSFVFRTSWVYSHMGNNFLKTILKLSKEREELKVIFDQIGTPTYAQDLAAFVHRNCLDSKRISPGIYHYSNEGVCSWYDFAFEILKQTNSHCRLYPIHTKNFPTPATRPHFSVLDKTKVKEASGEEIRHWKDSLKSCLDLIV